MTKLLIISKVFCWILFFCKTNTHKAQLFITLDNQLRYWYLSPPHTHLPQDNHDLICIPAYWGEEGQKSGQYGYCCWVVLTERLDIFRKMKGREEAKLLGSGWCWVSRIWWVIQVLTKFKYGQTKFMSPFLFTFILSE